MAAFWHHRASEQQRQDWQAHPWRPDGRHALAHAPVQLAADVIRAQINATTTGARLVGADTLKDAIGLLPVGLDTYSSYVDNFGGFPELLGRFGHSGAVLFSFTIFGNRAHCADIEPGAMHPADAPRFIDQLAIPIPGAMFPAMLYYSAGIAQEVIAAAGPRRKFIRLSAHYGAGPHICEPGVCGFPFAHGTQWADAGPHGENYDRQLWRPGVLRGAVTPPTPEEIMAITAAELGGVPHVFVERNDGSVWYTYQPQNAATPGPDRSWLGGQAGKQIAELRPFAPAPK